jgi:hypothetical protein
MRKRLFFAFLIAVAIVAATPIALAETLTFSYTYTNGPVTATGTLTGSAIGNGVYDITRGTISIVDLDDFLINGAGVFVPIPAGSDDTFLTGGGAYVWWTGVGESYLYPNLNPQINSDTGIFLFRLTSGYGAGCGASIASMGPDNYQFFAGNWDIDQLAGGGKFNALAIAPTPEPATLIFMGTGLMGVFTVVRRKFRT